MDSRGTLSYYLHYPIFSIGWNNSDAAYPEILPTAFPRAFLESTVRPAPITPDMNFTPDRPCSHLQVSIVSRKRLSIFITMLLPSSGLLVTGGNVHLCPRPRERSWDLEYIFVTPYLSTDFDNTLHLISSHAGAIRYPIQWDKPG